MSLSMIYGRSGRGKTTKLFELISKSIEDNDDYRKKRYIVVPDQFSFTMEKKVLEKFGPTSVFNIQVLGFRMLSQRILEHAGGIKRKVISPIGKSMLISDISRGLKDDFKLYGKSYDKEGFSKLVSSQIQEFKNYSIKPCDLHELSEKLDNESEIKYKIEDLEKLYLAYDKAMEDKYIDGEDKMSIAVDKFSDCEFLRDAEFYIDEFSDFTPMQFNMIEKMMVNHKTYITLTMDGRVDENYNGVFLLTYHTDKDILKIASDNNVELKKPIFVDDEGRFKEASDLSHIEKNLYTYPMEEYSLVPSNISIFKAQNPYEEIEFVAKDIIRRVREENLRYSDVAILLRNVENYESTLKSLMEEYKIPTFIDLRKSVDSNPLSSLIASFFDIYSSNFSHDSVFRYLKSGLVSLDDEEVYLLENYCLENGIKGHKWKEDLWRYSFSYQGSDLEEKRMINIVNEAKDIFYDPISDVFTDLEEAKDTKEMAKIFYDFLNKEKILLKFENWIDDFSKSNQELFREYSQTEDTILEVLDEIVETLGDRHLSVEEFGKTLLTGISSVEIALIPATLDQVIVGDISRVRSTGVRGIYVVGTNDGILPRIPETKAIINDEDRIYLKNKEFNISKDARIRAFYEQFYVYNALTTSSSFLCVTYPTADKDGKTLRPSMVIGRLKKLFPYLEEKFNKPELEKNSLSKEDIVNKNNAFRELVGQIRMHYDGLNINPIWREVYDYFKNDPQYSYKLKRAEDGIRYNNNPGTLEAENMDDLFSKKITLTVSKAESYNSCPFSYFVKYGLKAKDRKEHVVNAPDVGTLMHNVLDKFTANVSADNMTWKDINEAYIDKNVGRFMDELINGKLNSVFTSTNQMKFVSNKIKKVITSSLNVIKEQINLGEFNPIYSEVIFGENKLLEPIRINLEDDREVLVTGRIDRLDLLKKAEHNLIRVIDYKSSDKKMRISDIYFGLQLQLLIYLDVVLKNQDKILNDQVEGAGAFYSVLKRPEIDLTGREFDKETIFKEILSEMKLNGLILKDVDAIKAMDKNISENGASVVINSKINSKSELVNSGGRKTSLILDKEDFKTLREYANKMIKDMAMNLIRGNISIKPVKRSTSTACTFCNFKSICQFDSSIEGNEYKNVSTLKDEVALELIKRK